MMEVKKNLLLCLSLMLFLCLEYSIVICKNDGASVIDATLTKPGSETCSSIDCPTESKTGGLAVNLHHTNFLKLIYGGLSTAINNVYQTAQNAGEKIYSTTENYTAEFSEKVRKVLREEFRHLIVDGFTNVIDVATAPGSALYSLGITTSSVTLFLLCLLLNYIFLFFLSFISIITFDCIIFLLHYLLGPKLIFEYIFIFSGYFGRIMFFVWKYPYLFGLLVACLLCMSCLMPIIRIITRRNHRKQMRTLVDSLVDLNSTREGIRTRLTEIESKVDIILKFIKGTS